MAILVGEKDKEPHAVRHGVRVMEASFVCFAYLTPTRHRTACAVVVEVEVVVEKEAFMFS